MPPLRSTTIRSEPPTTLPYPSGEYPSSRLHAHQASWPEGTPVTFPVLAGRTAQTPPTAILRVSIITTGRPPSLAHLHG